jgi:hypothetical protein
MVGRSKEYSVTYPDLSGKGHVGHMCDRNNEIHVGRNQSLEDMESTLIHELIHAIDLSKKIGLTEAQVLKLEAGLVKMFRNNRWKILT